MKQISQKDWNNYIKTISKLDTKAADLIKDWVGKNGLANRDALIEYTFNVVQTFSMSTASLAADWYDAIAQLQGVLVPTAEIAELPTYGEVAKTVNGVLKRSLNPNTVASAASNLAKRTAADTTLKNAKRDGAEFAWIPVGDTCPFCMELASFGWRKASKKTIQGDHAEHIHANCDCEFAVRFGDDLKYASYDSEKYQKIFDNAEGDSMNDKINSIRRMQYQENKDVINAQKREAYAERQENEKFKDLSMNYGKITEKEDAETIDAGGDFNDIVRTSTEVEYEDTTVYISDKIIEEANVIMDRFEPYLNKAFDLIGRDHGKIPKIVIADYSELTENVAGRYLYDTNTVFFAPRLFGDMEENSPYNSHVTTHELLHWSDCQEMAKKYPNLSEDDLVEKVSEWAKNELDKLGIDIYSVNTISDYAEKRYGIGRFDEVYVEYRVKKLLGEE